MEVVSIKEYVCIKDLYIDDHPDFRFHTENKTPIVKVGEILKEGNNDSNCEDEGTSILENDKVWLRVSEKMLNEHFKHHKHSRVGDYIPYLNTIDSNSGERISFCRFKNWEYERNDDGTVTFILRDGVPYDNID